jgi:hypothetical protein
MHRILCAGARDTRCPKDADRRNPADQANVKLGLLPLTKNLVEQFEKDFPGGVPEYDFKAHSRVYNPNAKAAFFEMKYSK